MEEASQKPTPNSNESLAGVEVSKIKVLNLIAHNLVTLVDGKKNSSGSNTSVVKPTETHSESIKPQSLVNSDDKLNQTTRLPDFQHPESVSAISSWNQTESKSNSTATEFHLKSLLFDKNQTDFSQQIVNTSIYLQGQMTDEPAMMSNNQSDKVDDKLEGVPVTLC